MRRRRGGVGFAIVQGFALRVSLPGASVLCVRVNNDGVGDVINFSHVENGLLDIAEAVGEVWKAMVISLFYTLVVNGTSEAELLGALEKENRVTEHEHVELPDACGADRTISVDGPTGGRACTPATGKPPNVLQVSL